MQFKRQDLWSLEQYAEYRQDFRSKVIAHKKTRQVRIGDHITLIFEDQLTIQYQIQEMLRIEKIFDPEGIQEELDAYNPLIPDGNNWKCSMMIEYEDEEERRQRLVELIGIEDQVWIQVDDTEKIFPIADEDLDRTNDTKTSAVHFLRYQLPEEAIKSIDSTSTIQVGVDHKAYIVEPVILEPQVVAALAKDIVKD